MLLIRNANIKTMAGPDLKNGCLLLENGKIAAVGQTVDAPEGVETLDAQGRLLTPGCVEAHCHIGLDNEGMRWEGMDYNEIVEPLTPQLRAIDSINPQDEAFGLALRGGVTTACTGPGSANVVGGTFAIVKLAGKRVDRMILRAPAAMKCAFGENPKGCYGHDKRQSPMTRMAVAALLRELLLRTLRYRDDKAAGKNPAFDMKLEAMLPVVNGEIPLKCHAHRADDILTAVRIAREFGLKLTLDHCTDGELIADELAAGPGLRRTVVRRQDEGRAAQQELHDGGHAVPRGPDGQHHHGCAGHSAAVSAAGGRTGGFGRSADGGGVARHHHQPGPQPRHRRACRQS